MNKASDIEQPLLNAAQYFSDQTRWQSWLDVEATLALSQAEMGMIPQEAGMEIALHSNLKSVEVEKLRLKISQTMAPVFALSECLADVCGQSGAYVHWGATTQNIVETGRLLVLKQVQRHIFQNLSQVILQLSALAEQHAGLVMVGRTNRQNALPITFGFKIAGWIDELIRLADQLKEVEPRLFQLRFGGAIGGYHSLGADGARLSELMAERLGLHLSLVPNRTSVDPLIEYITKLSMIGVASARISDELFLLMTEEIAEVSEIFDANVVGSSTMPHKVNPKYVVDLGAMSMQLRTKAGAALAVPSPSHEADAVTNRLLTQLIAETCPLAINVLEKLHKTIASIAPNKPKMHENFLKSREMMATEGVMMRLAETVGRSHAHDIMHGLVDKAKCGNVSLYEIIMQNEEIVAALGAETLNKMLCTDGNIGQCETIALQAAAAGRKVANKIII
ncbi:MAG: hypothetical protein COC24_008935 [Alphaproteobacteria bacterium]|nr:hypothetical protein [Alphaproteobacteria bacterium]